MIQITKEFIDKLKSAKHCVVFTGAGISAESGVPTFRDAQTGLWARYDPMQLATRDAFRNNPKLVWDWYEYRRKLILETKPNPAHYAVVELEKYYPKFHLITQNVDGLHKQAGSKNIIELHGNIFRYKCFDEDKIIDKLPEISDDKMPPKCECGSYIRPDVVWFGEAVSNIDEAMDICSQCDLLFSIGTSSLVYPAAALPSVAKNNNAFVVEVNKERTPLSSEVDLVLLGKAGEIMPEVVRLLGC